MEPRLIKVTAMGKKQYRPDHIRLHIRYEKVFDTYRVALDRGAEYTAAVNSIAIKAGAGKDSVKTKDLSVRPNYQRYKDEKGIYREKLDGYELVVCLDVTIRMDNDLLSSLAAELSGIVRSFTFDFVLLDREKAEEEVLDLAVKKARRKAELLALASGVKLGEIQTIDHSYGQIRYEALTENCACEPDGEQETMRFDIDPEDLAISDTVTMVFAIA